MQALEFETEVSEGGALIIPPDIAEQLEDRQHVRVILLVEQDHEDWARLTEQQFLAGYSEEDAIYDKV